MTVHHPDAAALIRRLEQALAEQCAKLAEQCAKLAERDAKLAERDAKVAERDAMIEELVARIAALELELGKNSSNSSKPPSTDPPGKPKRRGKKSGKKRGAQKGHKGSHRKLLPLSQVDEVIHLFPSHCECGAALPRVVDPAPRRFQQTEWGESPRRVYVIEWQRHSVRCSCGHTTRAPVSHPTTAFGPRLTATIAVLTGPMRVSRRKVVWLMEAVFGIRISLGAVSAREKRVSDVIEPAFNEVAEVVDAAPIKHADGTSWKRGGSLVALWVIATVAATMFKVVEDSTAKTVRGLFGKLRGILVSDRDSSLGFWPMDKRQICWAHLLRAFVSFSERDGPAGALGRELLDYAKLVFAYWDKFQCGRMTRADFRVAMAPVRLHCEALIERAAKADITGLSGSCANLLAHKAALWTFVDVPGVEPTNNNAERELRAFVLWRKSSFGTQSERGDRFAERIMTVVHTARKQGIDVLEFLTASLRGEAPSLFA